VTTLHVHSAEREEIVSPPSEAAGTPAVSVGVRMSEALASLREHWPEYLIEGWALGTFMVSAGLFATLLDYPGSAVHQVIGDPTARRVLGGVAMGLTAMALIYSPWGQRSGAHMNPAVTLTFLRLGKTKRWDAVFFALAQFVGGLLGVLLVARVLGTAFTQAPVSYAATMPGAHGAWVALIAEVGISALMMLTILTVSNTPRLARFTGVAAGFLVATYISLEAPFSGMSMNPARSFASAAPGLMWQHLWIYVLAPVLGMLAGAQIYLIARTRARVACAKLLHPDNQRCIHCGYEPRGSHS
jgi:aquaporin Z